MLLPFWVVFLHLHASPHHMSATAVTPETAVLSVMSLLSPWQEEIMEFVNSIARIVHTSVAMHGGAANKNIGDAFLLVRPCSSVQSW